MGRARLRHHRRPGRVPSSCSATRAASTSRRTSRRSRGGCFASTRATASCLWEREAYAGEPRAARHVKSSQPTPRRRRTGRPWWRSSDPGRSPHSTSTAPVAGASTSARSTRACSATRSRSGDTRSSPVIFENLAIVQVDKHAGSFLAAYDLATGKPAWRVERDERPVWATPTLHRAGGRAELARRRRLPRARLRPAHRQGALALQGRRRGQDAHAVRERRPRDLRRRLSRPSALRDPSGRRRRRVGARDAKAGPFLAWRTEPGGPYTTTPLAYRDLLYAVRDEGVLGVYEREDRRARLPRAHRHDAQRLTRRERRQGLPRGRGRPAAGPARRPRFRRW